MFRVVTGTVAVHEKFDIGGNTEFTVAKDSTLIVEQGAKFNVGGSASLVIEGSTVIEKGAESESYGTVYDRGSLDVRGTLLNYGTIDISAGSMRNDGHLVVKGTIRGV